MQAVFKRRLLKLADTIEFGLIPGLAFNMYVWKDQASIFQKPDGLDFRVGPKKLRPSQRHTCDTVACIGGTAEIVFAKELERYGGDIGYVLGLQAWEAEQLFYPGTKTWDDITPRKAAKVIRSVAEGHRTSAGDIDWNV